MKAFSLPANRAVNYADYMAERHPRNLFWKLYRRVVLWWAMGG